MLDHTEATAEATGVIFSRLCVGVCVELTVQAIDQRLSKVAVLQKHPSREQRSSISAHVLICSPTILQFSGKSALRQTPLSGSGTKKGALEPKHVTGVKFFSTAPVDTISKDLCDPTEKRFVQGMYETVVVIKIPNQKTSVTD